MTSFKPMPYGSGVEILTGPERRRRRSSDEKLAMVRETYEPGKTVSLVARQHGVNANQLFRWRKLYQEGRLTAVQVDEDLVAAMRHLAEAFEHYKEDHPHSALNYQSPRELRRRAASST